MESFVKILIFILVILFIPITVFIQDNYRSIKRQIEENKKREIWLKEVEPKLRNAEGYPEDWWNRRHEAFLKSGGKCASCGKKIGFYGSSHVHHIQPIAAGGDHSLANLEFLCKDCHVKKHSKWSRLNMQ